MAEYEESEIKDRFKDFFEDEGYTPELNKIADNYPEEKSIYVDYNELHLYFEDVDFPRYVLDNPTVSFDQAQRAIEDLLGPAHEDVEIHLRIEKLPESRHTRIRDLRASDLSKYIAVDGLVRKATEVRPRITQAVFQCSRCKTKISQQQTSDKIEEPLECYENQGGCGKPANKANFKVLLDESTFQNYQTLEIQESPEGLRGGEQPQRLKGWVKEDLVGEVSPGDRITVNGRLDGSPKQSGKSKYRTFNIFMRVNSIGIKEYEYEDVELSEEDKRRIEEEVKGRRVFNRIVDSIAPSIQGLRSEKMGLALQLFGGVRKTMPDEQTVRGDIHILLVGDPGTAKSQLLRYISDLSPRGMYASGKGSTGAGLTAAAVREEVMGESRWILEAGTLVLSDKGIACVDELDKMRDEDRSAMHEAMEQQRISVAKAGINAQLNSRCAVLGAANPQYGRFEEHENISQQIKLPPPLTSRFDLIFAIMDKPDREKDKNIAKHIMGLHQAGEKLIEREDYEADERYVPPLDKEFFRKYIAYAKSIQPVMTDESKEKLEDFYLELRQSGSEEDSIPVTARQLESLVRLAEASARAHLRNTVTTDDAERAIKVTRDFLNQVASTEGGLDIDLVAAEVSHTERSVLQKVRGLLRELQEVHEGPVPKDEVLEKAEEEGVSRAEVKKELEMMKTKGEIYEPAQGKYKMA